MNPHIFRPHLSIRAALLSLGLSPAMLGTLAHSSTSANHSETLEEIRVVGSRQATLHENQKPSGTSVQHTELTSGLMEHFQQLSLQLPGTWVSRGDGVEHLTAIRSPVYTGAGACGMYLATEDGIPLFAKNFCNVNQLMMSHLHGARSTHVTRGPQSALFGGNALIGAIEIETEASRPTPKNTITVGASSIGNSTFNYQGSQRPTSNVIRGLSVSAAHNTGYRAHSGHNQQFIQLYQKSVNSNITRTDSLTLMQLEQETAGYIQGEDAYKNTQTAKSNPNPEAYRNANTVRGYSRFESQGDSISWIATPYFRYNKMQFLMHFVPWQPTETNQHRSIGLQLEATTYLSGTQLLFGQDIEYTSASLSEYQHEPSPFNQAGFPEGAHYDYRVRTTNTGWFVKATTPATKNLSIESAIRFDRDTLRYQNQLEDGYACENPNNCRFFRPQSQTHRFNALSPTLTATYTVTPEYTLFTQASKGFRTPQATELYRLQSSEQNHLDKVKGVSYEVGLRRQGEPLSYAITGYTMDIENDVFLDSDRRYVNNANTQHRGVEYEINYIYSENINAQLAGSFAEHLYENTPEGGNFDSPVMGKALDTAPKNMHGMSITWSQNQQHASTVQYEVMGAYYTDNQASEKYKGHSLVHLLHHWQINKVATASIKLSNALNTKYAERADYAFGESRYFPGLERRIGVQLSLQL